MSTNGYFKYNGINIRNISEVRVYRNDLYGRPTRGYQIINPPGRMGSIIRDNLRYPNVEMVYDILIESNFDTAYSKIRNVLLSVDGYARLEDSWNPDEFYQAYVSAPLEPRVSVDREKGAVTVVFSRRPERWLKSGETIIRGGYGNITNPTKYNAYPYVSVDLDSDKIAAETTDHYIIKMFEAGGVYMNFCDGLTNSQNQKTTKDVFGNVTRVTIDCATGAIDAPYQTSTNLRQYIYTFNTDVVSQNKKYLNEMPHIPPGISHYAVGAWLRSMATSSDNVCVTPRWYTI